MNPARVALVAFVAAAVPSLWLAPTAAGTDERAVALASRLRPDHERAAPCLTNRLDPGPSGERVLFALQAGVGAGLLCWALARRPSEREPR
ncbi:MAG: hypothetical protein U0599_18175 [Vicinamibacteria bacterium]